MIRLILFAVYVLAGVAYARVGLRAMREQAHARGLCVDALPWEAQALMALILALCAVAWPLPLGYELAIKFRAHWRDQRADRLLDEIDASRARIDAAFDGVDVDELREAINIVAHELTEEQLQRVLGRLTPKQAIALLDFAGGVEADEAAAE